MILGKDCWNYVLKRFNIYTDLNHLVIFRRVCKTFLETINNIYLDRFGEPINNYISFHYVLKYGILVHHNPRSKVMNLLELDKNHIRLHGYDNIDSKCKEIVITRQKNRSKHRNNELWSDGRREGREGRREGREGRSTKKCNHDGANITLRDRLGSEECGKPSPVFLTWKNTLINIKHTEKGIRLLSHLEKKIFPETIGYQNFRDSNSLIFIEKSKKGTSTFLIYQGSLKPIKIELEGEHKLIYATKTWIKTFEEKTDRIWLTVYYKNKIVSRIIHGSFLILNDISEYIILFTSRYIHCYTISQWLNHEKPVILDVDFWGIPRGWNCFLLLRNRDKILSCMDLVTKEIRWTSDRPINDFQIIHDVLIEIPDDIVSTKGKALKLPSFEPIKLSKAFEYLEPDTPSHNYFEFVENCLIRKKLGSIRMIIS